MKEMYDEIITWSKNIFLLPKGKPGKDFMSELTCIYNQLVEKTPWQRIVIPSSHVFMALMLQKPLLNSKASTNSKYLKERLLL
jgi:hypothetical protein